MNEAEDKSITQTKMAKVTIFGSIFILLLVSILIMNIEGKSEDSQKSSKKQKLTPFPTQQPSLRPTTMPSRSPSKKPSSSPTESPSQTIVARERDARPTFNDNYFLGTQAIVGTQWQSYRVAPFLGHTYDEPGFDMLTEFREAVATTGVNHFKFKLSPNACESYKLPCAQDTSIDSLTKLSQVSEVADTLADSRFKWYHIWGYTWSLRNKLKEPFTQAQLANEYNEVYEWTAHILQTYRQTDKVFMLGNWEGDWELMWSSGCKASGTFDMSCVPTEENIQKYILWANERQRAIDDAKADFGTDGVDVFFYLEFNLKKENYRNDPTQSESGSDPSQARPRPTMLNSVVPFVNPDFLSYSSYKSTNNYMNHQGRWFSQEGVDTEFWDLLTYAESKLAPKSTDLTPVLGDLSKRVFIGEFSPMRARDESLHVPSMAQMVRAALEWGCPFVLHWEIYDNYSEAMPLILDGTGQDMYTLSPLAQLFQDWSIAAQAYVASNNPSTNDLRLWAVSWFRQQYLAV